MAPATPSELRAAIDRLSTIELSDYFKQQRWPDWVEPTITRVVDAFAESSELERRQVLAYWKPEAAPPFGWYARKMAGVAVRTQAHSDLRNGLIAITLAAAGANNREQLPPLALLYDSAERIGGDANTLFAQVAVLFARAGKAFLAEFLARDPSQKSAGAFGFRAGVGPDGFDYVPLP